MQAAIGALDDGGGHGGTGALATLHAVGHGAAVGLGHEGEVGQLVVEQEPGGHDAGAERVLHRGGHADRVAEAIDDGQVRGAGFLRKTLGGHAVLGAAPGRVAGTERAGAVHVDQLGTGGEVRGVDQAGDRNGHEIAVGQIGAAIGEGELAGLDADMRDVRVGRLAGQHEMVHNRQDLQHSHAAGTRRAHAADAIQAERAANEGGSTGR